MRTRLNVTFTRTLPLVVYSNGFTIQNCVAVNKTPIKKKVAVKCYYL
jgi:hypothetical protein